MLRVISDIHGEYKKYLPLLACEASIQIGDLGFDYSPIPVNSNHRFFRGNHDDYDVEHPNCLGDFGNISLGGIEVFYVRGAHSIDKDKRILGISYWDQEEISYPVAMEAMDLYEVSKPRIVLSHDCPSYVAGMMGIHDRSKTRTFLQSLFEMHNPSLWIYGHHHRDFKVKIGNTKFVCLPIGGHMDLEA